MFSLLKKADYETAARIKEALNIVLGFDMGELKKVFEKKIYMKNNLTYQSDLQDHH